MAKVPYSVETLPKISIVWVGRTNVTDRRQTNDRQTTDRQTTDGRTTTYSEHELEFTFAKNRLIFEEVNAYQQKCAIFGPPCKCSTYLLSYLLTYTMHAVINFMHTCWTLGWYYSCFHEDTITVTVSAVISLLITSFFLIPLWRIKL